MTVEDLIDSALAEGDNVPSSDAAYIERRRRALAFLRERFDEVWWARDWPRRKTEARLTMISGDGHVPTPSDFSSLGQYGGLYLCVGGEPKAPMLTQVPESVITDFRTQQGSTDSPEEYAIFGFEEVAAGAGVFRDLIQTRTNTSDLTFELHYQRKAPKLLDKGDPDADLMYTSVTLTRSGSTVTATTTAAHELETDDPVIISGADQAEYNGTFSIIVTGDTTFLYDITGTPVTPATGLVVANIALAQANSAVNYIPEEFHRTVLLNGLKAKLRESKGDARWQYMEGEYQKNLVAMKKQRVRFEGEYRQMPSFFGRARR